MICLLLLNAFGILNSPLASNGRNGEKKYNFFFFFFLNGRIKFRLQTFILFCWNFTKENLNSRSQSTIAIHSTPFTRNWMLSSVTNNHHNNNNDNCNQIEKLNIQYKTRRTKTECFLAHFYWNEFSVKLREFQWYLAQILYEIFSV